MGHASFTHGQHFFSISTSVFNFVFLGIAGCETSKQELAIWTITVYFSSVEGLFSFFLGSRAAKLV
jgi:hypothetical protein